MQFVPAVSGETVRYTSRMYAGADAYHVYLFASQEDKDEGNSEANYLLKIAFKRNFGVDTTVDEDLALCVDIDGWSSMEIFIKKDYYDPAKKVYLNGEDITSMADSTLSKSPKEESTALGTFWHDAVYYFEDFGLVQGNSSNYINKIEYK